MLSLLFALFAFCFFCSVAVKCESFTEAVSVNSSDCSRAANFCILGQVANLCSDVGVYANAGSDAWLVFDVVGAVAVFFFLRFLAAYVASWQCIIFMASSMNLRIFFFFYFFFFCFYYCCWRASARKREIRFSYCCFCFSVWLCMVYMLLLLRLFCIIFFCQVLLLFQLFRLLLFLHYQFSMYICIHNGLTVGFGLFLHKFKIM